MISASDLSIRNKIVIIILSVAYTSMFVAFGVIIIRENKVLKEKMLAEATMSAKLVGEYCIAPLDFDYPDAARASVEKLSSIPDIYNGHVYDHNGKLFAAYNKLAMPDSMPAINKYKTTVFDDKWLHVIHPLTLDNAHLGTIYLRVSTEPLRSDIRTLIYTMLIINLGAALLAYILALGAQRIVSLPILKLAAFTRKIRMKGDYSLQIENNYAQEFGDLYTGVNQMLKQIDYQRKEQLKADKELRQKEERFRNLAKMLPVGVFEADLRLEINYANNRALEMFGYNYDDLIKGLNGFDLVHPDQQEYIKNNLKKRLDKKLVGDVEYKAIRKDGSIFYILFNMTAIYNNSEMIGFRGTVVDITARRNAEEELISTNSELKRTTQALKRSNAELQQALKEASRSKALEEANQQLMLREKQLKDKQVELEQMNAALHESHKNTQQLNQEILAANQELQRKNETLNRQKKEINEAFEQLKHTQLQLVQAEKMASLGILTAGVAHELNNPLNFINGSAYVIEDYIKENVKDNKEVFTELINNIYEGVNRATSIIKSLNHFSRSSDESEQVVDLHAIINNCLIILNNQIKHRVKVVKEFCAEKFVLTGNDGKLHQVFLNIITNSVQAIDDDGQIKISTIFDGENIDVKIEDNGCGISPENLEKIMDPFFTTKPPGKGTGLGLSIAYKIIDEHQGKITYHSALGKGTIVVVSLPAS